MKKYLNQYLIPVLISLFVFGIPIWDKLMPMQGSEQIIEERYGHQFSWCVALSGFSNSKVSASSRIYILFPAVFSDGALADVKSINGNYPSISIYNYGALLTLFVYASMTYSYFKSRKKNTKNPDEVQINNKSIT
jgi:hypothetical protein